MSSGHCFTYGSLMCEDIMSAVCGHAVRGEPATLRGFSRHPVRHASYPGITPDPLAQVCGVVYRALGSRTLMRLDAFEGEHYCRTSVQVECADGSTIAAETYVFHSAHAGLLLPGDWDFDEFVRIRKRDFIARYVGFTRI